MEADISNKTIVVLVVLTVVISVLSTLLMMNEVGKFKTTPSRTTSIVGQDKNTAHGEVSVTVLPKPETKTATGYVTLTIQPRQ